MSCRSTVGGQAASACGTILTGQSADDASRVMHTIKAASEEENPDASAPTAQQVVDVLDNLAFHVRNEIEDSPRRERVLAKVEEALLGYRSGDAPLPDAATLRSWQVLPVALEADAIITGRAVEAATEPARSSTRRPKPYHKRFQNFNASTLAATNALFRARPSRLSQAEVETVFTTWIHDVSEAYGMPEPSFRWDPDAVNWAGGGYYTPTEQSISMSHASVTTLIHEYRHHMQAMGARMVDEDVEIDARAWSLSLYYKVRPALLERLVREGKIFHILPQDFD